MIRYLKRNSILLFFCLLNLAFCQAASAVAKDSLACNGFGYLKLYKPEKTPAKVVICISGDGGWETGIENIALHLKDDETLIIGVDIRKVIKYMNASKSACVYPAADFERMSQLVQKKLGYKTYNIPVLLGYSSGATLVYGLLAQAPQNTFKAGIVLGFCPDFDIKKPLCQGSGKFTSIKRKDGKGFNIGPVKNLSAPFISLQGEADQVCNYASTLAFLKNVPGAKIISLPNVGHGYGTEKNWVPQLVSAFKEVTVEKNVVETFAQLRKLNLPLHTTLPAARKTSESMVVFISGDGGWTGFDQQIVDAFAAKGLSVIGLDALKYFWEKKTPAELAADINKIIELYAAEWKKEKFILVGYSFGADVMPFAYNRLPENVKKNVVGLGLLSPSKETDMEIHVSDLLDFSDSGNGMSVPAEINKTEGLKPICFFGKDESDTPAKQLSTQKVKIVYLSGGHHYTNAFEIIASTLIP